MSDETIVLDRPPKAPVELRAAETLEVRFPDRVVEVLAMPYEQPTGRVVRNGQQIVEIVSRGAFGHVERRKDVRVYRDHDKSQIAGRVIALHPDRADGLVAELRMSKTAIGDETLELAAERLLDVSVGFAPIRERWSPDRRQRRLDRCYLDHIAMVGDPAYDGAQVLDVRHADPAVVAATPNKDMIRALLFEIGYSPGH